MKRSTWIPLAIGLAGIMALPLWWTLKGPYREDRYVEIAPNETAFLIPLEGDSTQQGRMQSIEALNEAKVMAKRVYLPLRKRKLGRGWMNYEWVPTLKVVTVDRTPVTRDWTRDPTTGTSSRNQALEVESQDSINFGVGLTVTCRVEEQNTARFLYYYSGKSLAEIVDSNVRGFCQQRLAGAFGTLDLVACKREKARIFEALQREAREFFAQKGITVDFLGGIKGLQYHNAEIQDAIDRKFIRELDAQTAQQELREQEIRNQIDLSIAEAERDSARELARAEEALRFKTMLDVAKTEAEATRAAAAKWSGSLPSGMMPAASELLFGLERRPAGELLDRIKELPKQQRAEQVAEKATSGP